MPSPYDALLSAAPEPAQAASPSPYDALLTAAAPRQSSQYDQLLAAVKPPSSTPATDDATDPFQGTAPNWASPIEERTKAFVQNLGIPYNVESLKEAGKFLIRSPVQDIKDIGTALYELPGKIANIGQTIQTSPAATVARAPLSPEAFGVYGTAAGLLLPAGERLVRGVEPSGVSRMPEPSAPSEAGPSGQVPPATEVQYRPLSGRPPVEPVVAPEAAQVQGTPEMARVQPEVVPAAETVSPEPTGAATASAEPPVTLTERELPEGDVTGTHAIDITNPAGENIGYIGGSVTPEGFEVNISHIDKGQRGKGFYQDAIRQMADRYGTVRSDVDMAPSAESAWKKVGAERQGDGSYVLKGGEQYASPITGTSEVSQPEVRPRMGEAPPLRPIVEEPAPVQGDVGGGAAEPKAQAPVIEKDAVGNLATRVSVGGKPLIIKVTPNGSIVFRAIHEYPGGETHELSSTGAGAFKTMNEIVPVIQDLVRAKLRENPNQTFWYNAEPGRTTLYQRYLKKAGIEAEPQVPFKIPEDHPLRQAAKPAEPKAQAKAINLADPNAAPEHRGPSLALKLDDGTILYANDVRLHSQILDKSGIDPTRVVDSGLYRPISKEFVSKTPESVEVYPKPAPQEAPVRVADPDPHISSIANKFVAERVKAGQIGEIALGQGFATEDLTARGLRMPPEQVNQHISDVMNNRGGNPIDQAAAIRGEEARLSQRSNQLSRASEANPRDLNARLAADNAFKDLTDFHNGPVARLKNNWHAQGMAMQGEVPVDLSTYNGLREAWLKDNGMAPPADVEPTLRRVADKVKRTVAEENGAMQKLGQEIEKATERKKLPTADEVRNKIRERMKIGPCKL